MSDFWPHGRVAECYGILRSEGYSERAVFVIDKRGFVRFAHVYDKDHLPDNQDIWDILGKIEPRAAYVQEQEKQVDLDDLPHGGIVIYSTSWCPDTRRARAWLKERGLEYTEVNTSENASAAAQVRIWGKGYKISPTIDIDGEIVLNFDENRLLQVLKEKNYL